MVTDWEFSLYLLYLSFACIVNSIAGLIVYMVIRRHKVLFTLRLVEFALTYVGLKGALTIDKRWVVAHGFLTTALVGGFLLFQVVQAVFGSSKTDDWITTAVCSPLLIDLVSGLYFLYVGMQLLDEGQLQPAAIDQPQAEPMNVPNEITEEVLRQNECTICLDRPRNVVFYKCGHKLACELCAWKLCQSRNQNRCPLCRRIIEDILKVYDN